jgi:hexosaminidase
MVEQEIGMNNPGIIPTPNKIDINNGILAVDSIKAIVSVGELSTIADYLCNCLKDIGIDLLLKSDNDGHFGSIILERITETDFSEEEYELEIDEEKISLKAGSDTGLFYAVQTLRQLLSSCEHKGLPTSLQCMKIYDKPRFSWRGYMLDESRHFLGKDHVKKMLDWMAYLKLNRFHWHLTDEPAWRIEIKQYPKLTEIGSRGSYSDLNSPPAYYAQEDIREIVEYAKARHIVIIPEIDMPGHAGAANRSYPEFSGGGSELCPEFTFNPGNEGAYSYLENILREVTDLFPGQWLHFGGDEVHYGNEQWNHDPLVQKKMKENKYTTLKEMEFYFIERMSAFINKLGKTPIGWDEIVNSSIPSDKAAVMWWRHDQTNVLAEACKKGFKVILSPRSPCYLDFVQHESHLWGRQWADKEDFDVLQQLYNYPESKSVSDILLDSVLGIQVNLWTETVKGTERAEFMTFPRLFALAEAAWTHKGNKDIQSFNRRLEKIFPELDCQGTAYFNPFDLNSTPEIKGVEKASGGKLLEEEIGEPAGSALKG